MGSTSRQHVRIPYIYTFFHSGLSYLLAPHLFATREDFSRRRVEGRRGNGENKMTEEAQRRVATRGLRYSYTLKLRAEGRRGIYPQHALRAQLICEDKRFDKVGIAGMETIGATRTEFQSMP